MISPRSDKKKRVRTQEYFPVRTDIPKMANATAQEKIILRAARPVFRKAWTLGWATEQRYEATVYALTDARLWLLEHPEATDEELRTATYKLAGKFKRQMDETIGWIRSDDIEDQYLSGKFTSDSDSSNPNSGNRIEDTTDYAKDRGRIRQQAVDTYLDRQKSVRIFLARPEPVIPAKYERYRPTLDDVKFVVLYEHEAEVRKIKKFRTRYSRIQTKWQAWGIVMGVFGAVEAVLAIRHEAKCRREQWQKERDVKP
jgi:hypothetical protein